MNPEELKKPEAKAESEQARLQANRIDMDFSHLDAQAIKEANEQPAVKDYVNDLQSKLGEIHQTLEDLRSSITKGEHKTEDLDGKVTFEKKLDAARFKAHHAFAKPEEPSRVGYAQTSLENAGDNYQNRFIKPAEIMQLALDGEQSDQEKYPGEMAKQYNVGNVRENISTEQLAELQSKISACLDRLNDQQKQIEEIASSKALSPGEKDETLKNYARMFEEYEKKKTELTEVLQDVEKARK